VFDTSFGRIGFAICSEVYMPELCRILALKGAEFIFLPAGVPKGPMWETWRTLIFARAIENLCFTATCQNLFDPADRGLAMICSPENVMIESTQAGVFVADCDLDRLRLLRETEDTWDFPGIKHCKPGIFKQWYRPELHTRMLDEINSVPLPEFSPVDGL
jgi:predicted amidohydrolase